MGYYARGWGENRTGVARPIMKVENFVPALERFREVMLDPDFFEANARGGSWGPNGKTEKWYSWTNDAKWDEMEDIREVLEVFGFHLTHDDGGNLLYMEYDSKTGQEDLLLETISSFFEPGSRVEWTGEDGSLWATDLNPYRELTGRVVYD